MNYFKLLLPLIFMFNANGQILKDSLSVTRDVTFFSFSNKDEIINLKRVLKKAEKDDFFSIRKGRELLASSINEKIFFEFEEIDGYSALFLEDAVFKILDLNNDGFNELIIEIDPFESFKRLWIYTIESNKKFKFILSTEFLSFDVINENILRIVTNPFCEQWGDCLYETLSLNKYIDFNLLRKLDFYCLSSGKFKNVNHLYPHIFVEQQSNYKQVLNQLDESNLLINLPSQAEKLEALKRMIREIVDYPSGARL